MLEYIQIWSDMEALFEPYDDAQRGRLIMAMMAYAYRGEEPEFTGVEKFIWPVLRQHIDRCTQNVEAKKAAGSRGGSRAKADKQTQADAIRQKQSEAEASESKQTEADASESKRNAHTKYHDHEYDHDQYNDEEVSACARDASASSSAVEGIDGTDLSQAIALNAEVDKLMAKYRIAEYNRDALMDEVGKHGLDKIREVLKSAAESDTKGGLSIKFIRACIETHGKAKLARAAPTHDPHMQRYTPEERRATWGAAVVDFDN